MSPTRPLNLDDFCTAIRCAADTMRAHYLGRRVLDAARGTAECVYRAEVTLLVGDALANHPRMTLCASVRATHPADELPSAANLALELDEGPAFDYAHEHELRLLDDDGEEIHLDEALERDEVLEAIADVARLDDRALIARCAHDALARHGARASAPDA